MRVTTDRLLEFIDNDSTFIWLAQIIANLLIIIGILINVGLIRARNIQRSASLESVSTYKKPNLGWSLDLTNTKIDQNRKFRKGGNRHISTNASIENQFHTI
jgi:hypothetical protein